MDIASDALRQLPMRLRMEIEENILRKDFTESELGDIQQRLIAYFSQPGKKQQGRRTDLKRTSTPIGVEVEKPKRWENVTEKVARLFGEGENTVRRRMEVLKHAEAEPAKYAPLIKQMDKTGKVDGAYRQLQKVLRAEEITGELPPLPTGPFRVIVADPPWHYTNRAEDLTHRAAIPYPSMDQQAICDLAVPALSHADAVLWLWTTNAHLREAFAVVEHWGFVYKTLLTWVKDRMGTGDWLRGQTEQCLLAVRGTPTVLLTNQTTALQAPVREHSRKPEAFYALVETLCPGAKVELFARAQRPGWVTHGTPGDQWMAPPQ